MTYEQFEKASELKDEIDYLVDVETTIKNARSNELCACKFHDSAGLDRIDVINRVTIDDSVADVLLSAVRKLRADKESEFERL